MSCTNCPQVELPCCSSAINLGIAPALTPLWLSIEDVTNNRLLYISIDLNGSDMQVDISDFTFSESHSYIFTIVAPQQTDSWTTGLSWLIPDGITEVECLQVRFKKINNEDMGLLNAGTITITKQW